MRIFLLSCMLWVPLWGLSQVQLEKAYFNPKELHPVWLESNLAASVFPKEDLILIQDYSEVHFELFSQVPQIRYEIVRYVKVNEAADLSSASLSFSVSKERDESLFRWKASTLSFNAKGEIIAFPVSRRGAIRKKGEDEDRYTINFPFVKPGVVLELRYSIRTTFLEEIRPWTFQGTLPVIMSSVRTFIPYSYQYLLFPSGNLDRLVTTNAEFERNSQLGILPEYDGETRDLLSNSVRTVDGNALTYTMMQMPAIRESEAFSPASSKSYVPSLGWQLSQDLYNRENNANLFDSWQQLDRLTFRRFKFKKLPRRFRIELQDRVSRTSRLSKTQAIQNLYEYFARFSWEGIYKRVPENLGKAWKEKRGTSAEINTLLLHTLREAGIEAYPVLISTRSNGYSQGAYPLISQFNHLLVAYRVDGETVLLDASSGISRAGLLPTEDLNGEGFLLNGRGGEWVPLQSYQKVNQITYSRFTMAEDGSMDGEISVINQNFSSELESVKLQELGEDVQAYFESHVWAGLDAPRVSNGRVQRSEGRSRMLEISADVNLNEFVLRTEDLLILRPMLMRSLINNPFAEEDRIAPVVLPYPVWEAHMLGLRIPEGYEVVQVPESIRVMMPGNAGQFIYNVVADNRIIHVTSSIEINRTRYSPEEYQGIRDFFAYIVSKHEEDIVIKKLN